MAADRNNLHLLIIIIISVAGLRTTTQERRGTDAPRSRSPLLYYLRGVGGTIDSEPALRFAGTHLSRVRSPLPAPCTTTATTRSISTLY
ncbi:hypothetical protein PoB_004998200 [Plakobranchus ocellatus]|uniref:Secreted protein n=1 Tax=Plakobranchus ocellatus TaxID=259542 RepID=A0AAV4BWP2_9GAST|nr:hypothetical protein PoB_004998200 [Plakobranchus ocellatus]